MIETRCSKIFTDEYGIIHNVHKSGVEINLNDAKEDNSAVHKIAGGKEFVILVDSRQYWSISDEARDYFSTPEGSKNTKALALVVRSTLTRDSSNAYLNKIAINHPTKFFTSEKKAIDWLKQYV